ncbi:MAG: hypothetical protein M3416_05760 [Acidobacteriota bacterium]|nr:hypothetical protein [Acidobacteriota bacterium]
MSALAVVGAGLIWIGARTSARAQDESAQTISGEPDDFHARINQRAQAAGQGRPGAVHALASEVVYSLAPRPVPDFTRAAMAERLARAEEHYRATGEGGIPEENVATMVNELADKFGAPEYAKTDREQTRFLRVRMMRSLPHLVGQEMEGDSVSRVMSPAEAAAVALTMVQQKMYNEDYQVPAKDFKEHMRKKQEEKNKEKDRGTGKPRLVAKARSDKHKKMREAVAEGAAAMGGAELMSLADNSLDTLGVRR